MGAMEFTELSWGRTCEEAFSNAVHRAQWEFGHGGYTGTIAEKGEFVFFDLPPRVTPEKVREMLYEAMLPSAQRELRSDAERWGHKLDKVRLRRGERAWAWLVERFGLDAERLVGTYHDKWGPAVAFPAKGRTLERFTLEVPKPGRGYKAWMFTGWASC